jgi:hypothetical protein
VLGRATGNTNTQDSPRPGLGGSHHLPPYSILCSLRRRWHPNGYFSRDSRVRVPKLSRVGVPGLWTPISPDCKVRSRRDLKQSCSPHRELSNAMLHSQIGCREEVDSWLLVIGSQNWRTPESSTPGPSFGHNLCFRCPNEQCEPILDIYTSRAFHWYKERNKPWSFDPSKRSLKFQESFWDSTLTNSQRGSSLGSVRVHSLTLSRLFALLGACDVTPGSTSRPATSQPPCLGRKPNARVATISETMNVF